VLWLPYGLFVWNALSQNIQVDSESATSSASSVTPAPIEGEPADQNVSAGEVEAVENMEINEGLNFEHVLQQFDNFSCTKYMSKN